MTAFRTREAIEAAAFAAARTQGTKAAKFAAAKMGGALFELPVVKTAWIPFLASLAALIYVKLRGEKWSDYGLKGMKTPLRLVGAGLLLTVIYLAYSILLEPVVDDAVSAAFGAPKNLAEQNFADVVGNLRLYLIVLPFIWLFAAFGEEFFYRGFLMTKIARAFGEGRIAWIIAVIAQAAVFGLAHAYQGPVGMIGTGVVALLYGAATLICGRSLGPAMIAHGLVDTLGFTLLYLGMLDAS